MMPWFRRKSWRSLDQIAGKDATLSGNICVYGGKLTVEKGNNSNLSADDISLTIGAGLSTRGTTNNSESVNLTGGTEHEDGSVTYGKAAFANLTNLAVKPVVTVTSAPIASILTYTEQAQALVTAGEADGGTMQYALGTATEATQPYTTSIPTATDSRDLPRVVQGRGRRGPRGLRAGCRVIDNGGW